MSASGLVYRRRRVVQDAFQLNGPLHLCRGPDDPKVYCDAMVFVTRPC
jgi:hypothetical protein